MVWRWLLLVAISRTLAVRTTLGEREACSIKEALRVTYLEPVQGPVGLTGVKRSGQFDFIRPSAWNGLTLAQKFYGVLGSCVVDYAVHCSGKDAVLKLTDSCGERSDNRSLWFARSTELHMEKSWLHPWRKGHELILKVFLASQHRSIRMTQDGSKVTFRLVSPPTLEEQLADPNNIRFFAQVPKVASCLPDDRDDIFKSTTQNASFFGAQECSACQNLLESKIKGTELCDSATTSASNLRCKVFANGMAKEGVLELVVSSIQSSWQQAKDMAMPLSWKLGCQDLGCCPLDPEVSKALIEEADRVLKIEKFADKQRELRARDAENVPSGVVEKILTNSTARLKLEGVLNTKAHLNNKGIHRENLTSNLDLKKLQVAVSDDGCRWNFRKSRCTPRGSCAYKFRLGDVNFHQSCRLKAGVYRPMSDEECLWNYKKAMCHHPQYCARRCKGGDWTLDACCKLRKVMVSGENETDETGDVKKVDDETIQKILDDMKMEDDTDNVVFGSDVDEDIGLEADEETVTAPSSPKVDEDIGLEADEETITAPSSSDDESDAPSTAGEDVMEGNCRSDSDRSLLSTPGFAKALEKDVRASLTWKLNLKRDACHERHIKRGLSEMCASCFVDVTDCAFQHCFRLQSTAGPNDEKTKLCMEKKNGDRLGCQPQLRKCTGLSDDQLPQQ